MMSARTPFAVSSKCVVRSETDPDLILENVDTDKVPSASKVAGAVPSALSRTKPAMLTTDGHAESGWIVREEDENSFISQQSSCTTPEQASRNCIDDKVENSSKSIEGEEFGLFPRRTFLSNYSLPHPSKLRRKEGASRAKRKRNIDKEEVVEMHVQQLKKKRMACFTQKPKTVASPTVPDATSPWPESQSHTVYCVPQTAGTAEMSREESAFPVTAEEPTLTTTETETVSVDDDDEEHWLKRHWRYQQPKRWSCKTLEE